MLSSSDLIAPPLYLELSPPPAAADQVSHLFMFRDSGVLSGRGSGRFATDLFTLSLTPDDSGCTARVSIAPPRPEFTPRPTPSCGIVAGLRLSSRPERMPEADVLDSLASDLDRVRQGDDALPSLVATLDRLALGLRFAPPPAVYSDRTKRRKVRADTGVSRRRLAASQRFRRFLEHLAAQSLPLSGLALDAGYYDQSHLSAACRAYAGKPPGALRSQVAQRHSGLSLQDARLEDRLRLVITE